MTYFNSTHPQPEREEKGLAPYSKVAKPLLFGISLGGKIKFYSLIVWVFVSEHAFYCESWKEVSI